MYFSITIESDSKAEIKIPIIVALSNLIADFTHSLDYGTGVQRIYIGCICMNLGPGYEAWYQVRKPRYRELQKVRMLDNSLVEEKCAFAYDIKLDYEPFLTASDEDSRKMLAQEILKSLVNLDKLPKKVKDFDKERFKADIERFFTEQGLI